MTLDEAIKHAEEVAEEKENEGKLLCQSEGASIGCLICAKEHRQLAEWLKDYKRMLEQEPKYCDRNICLRNEYNGIGCDECEVTKGQEPKYCDRNICLRNEYNGIGCDECEVTKGQEPSSDTISREQALSSAKYIYESGSKMKAFSMIKMLEELSSVTPQQKTGHWIEEVNDYGEVTHWHCDKCYEDSGFTTTCKWDYCPNCGTKVIES